MRQDPHRVPKRLLKNLRAWPPLNDILTRAARAFVHVTGIGTEFCVKHLPRSGVVRSQLPNGRVLALRSQGDDWIANQVFWRGWAGYEAESTPLFFRLAGQSRVILDIGAFIGFHSILAALANPQARIFAFEPLPAAYERLQRNLGLSGVRNVTCVNSAVGESTGEAALVSTVQGLPSSSTLVPGFLCDAESLRSLTVSVMAIDDFAKRAGLERVDLAKIDVETAEPMVLRGMSHTLERDHPDLFCEVLPGRDTGPEIDRLLRPCGYRYYLLTPEGPVAHQTIRGHDRWFNYLLTSKSLDALLDG